MNPVNSRPSHNQGPDQGVFGTDVLRRGVGLSESDRELIRALQRDGRAPFAELARNLGLPEKSVRKRVAELRQSGIIHITAVSNPEMLGYRVAAMIFITCDRRAPSEVAEAIAELDVVDYSAVIAGRFDIFVEVFCLSLTHLREIVERQIRGVPGVNRVEILPFLTLRFQQAVFNPDGERPSAPASPAELPEQVDRDIIAALGSDGRMSLHAIAERLGVSDTQVRRRLERMRRSNVVRIMAITNPMTLGFETIALIGVNVTGDHTADAVADAISQVPHVSYIAICAGRYELLVEVVCLTLAELQDLLDDRLKSIEGVERLEPFVYLGLHYKPLPPATASRGSTPLFAF